jgi:histidine ammonia-lyase
LTVVLRTRSDIDLDAYERVARHGEGVEVAPQALERMAACRRSFLALLEREPELVVYGVTTGFGERAGDRLDAEERAALARQPPLTGSSFGEPLPEPVVRGIVLARLANFVDGHAAVRPELAIAVAVLLDGELPAVPLRGNGGSGEILALGHLFHEVGTHVRLEPKEGLALVNGSPCAAALAADLALDARRRLPVTEQVFALAAEALGAPLDAYGPELEELWEDEAEAEALRSLRASLEGGAADRRGHQAPVSFRILPRLLGRARRALAEAERAAAVSLRAVTDNPVYANGRVLSNGGYHNALAPPALDGLAFAAADLCQLAERQTEALLRELLADGRCPRPLSTLSMVQAAWAEDARSSAQPTILPLGGLGQNDTPAPSFFAWEKARRVASCLDASLATLAVVASNSLHARGRAAPPALAGLLDDVRACVPVLDEPRPLGDELARLTSALVSSA